MLFLFSEDPILRSKLYISDPFFQKERVGQLLN